MVPIPEREMAVAKTLGLTEVEARRSWERYVTLTTERHGEHILLGGFHWKRWAEEDAGNGAAKRNRAQEAKHAKALEDEAYTREAMTVGQYALRLEARANARQALEPDEVSLLEFFRETGFPDPTSRSITPILAHAEWRQARGLGPMDEQARTVTVRDDAGYVQSRRLLSPAELRARRSPALPGVHRAAPPPEPELAHQADDDELEERRQQALRDLGEFAAGLGLEGTGT